ncbi:MAG TPA: ATP-binding protein [Cyclobacteriaceae bacterium]|jgi:serine/threonine-protein kinase RsbW|nr:ATP-binding protein [Cytophagales bacterium]HMR56701.1 ATP-binding protein [Cyclobacteriaceae bacterium]HRE67646.1 ATP-binding protein [Cyclobacteriaceae bacterium]HRF33799.1 ATP-binding protein [Cyclobacteriaceae bacterium]
MNYQYNIGCSLSNLKGIREFVRTSLKDQQVPEIEMSAIVLALDEMCSNLMIHAHHCNPEHMLELHIEIPAKGKFIFEIVDDGSIFDINEFHEPELDNLVHQKRKGGLGIRLVKAIMDSVEYLRRDEKNVCRLIKVIK